MAGCYTKGDVAVNVHKAIEAGDKLAKDGWCPFIPHLTHFWHLVSPHPWEFWMAIDQEVLKRCDAIYMMRGFEASQGATKEHIMAYELGLEIYYEQ